MADCRLIDVEVLLKKRRFDTAVYLGGYVIECYLKYIITQKRGIHFLPANLEIHSLDLLAAAAFSDVEWQQLTKANKSLERILDDWSPAMRYQTNVTSAAEAKRYCTLIDLVYRQLKELIP